MKISKAWKISHDWLNVALLGMLWLAFGAAPIPAWAQTLPLEKRPSWVREEGLIMAGSWEPLLFRVRRDGSPSYEPSPQQLAAWQREHSPEMVQRLKDLGINLAIIHCYKGAGLKAERESMAEAVRFARLCREAGLRVGVYTYSGAFLWELFFEELPQARDWLVLRADGQPIPYGRALYRYYWNRNHPDAQRFYQQIIRFAVEEIQADLIYFDNYIVGPGYEAVSVERFRRYLRENFSPSELAEMGMIHLEEVLPPTGNAPPLLRYAWQDFSAQSLADSYHVMSRYARSLRPDVLIGLNPGGVGNSIRPPVDHGRMLPGGDCYWVESGRVGLIDGRLVTRIPNYKVGQALLNMTFDYTITPLELAESMAFNLDTLGCIAWFEWGELVSHPGSRQPVDPAILPFVQFYRRYRELYRDAVPVCDAAVLRSFASQVFGGSKFAQMTHQVEQQLIEQRVCFQIIYDQQLSELSRYRAVVLAGCPALGQTQSEALQKFVAQGGKLCVLGELGTHDQWFRPRARSVEEDLPPQSLIRFDRPEECAAAVRTACGGRLTVEFGPDTPIGLCAELWQQPHRRLLHLVNYRSDGPVSQVSVELAIPEGKRPKMVQMFSPEEPDGKAIAFRGDDDRVRFTVPKVDIYLIVAVHYE
jgi:hypothetical protein